MNHRLNIAVIAFMGLIISLIPVQATPETDARYIYDTFGEVHQYANITNDSFVRHGTGYNIPEATNDFLNRFKVLYNGTINRTYFVYGNATSSPTISFYNHTNGSFATPVQVDDAPIQDDAHTHPSMVMDNDGYLYLFYGSHSSDQYMIKSTNPYEITAWDAPKTIVGDYTYPQVFMMGNTMYWFFRNNTKNISYKTSTNYQGAWTWSSETVLINETGNNIPYPIFIRGNETPTPSIHVAWLVYDGTNYKNVNYAYTTNAGTTWKRRNGFALTLPLRDSNSERLYTYNYIHGYINDIQLDADNNPFIIFTEGNSGTVPNNVKMIGYSGGAWVSSTILTANSRYNIGTLRINGTTKNVYVSNGGDETGDVPGNYGGEIQEYTSTDDTTWTKTRDISYNSSELHGIPLVALNSSSLKAADNTNLSVIWSYGNNTPGRLYGWGSTIGVNTSYCNANQYTMDAGTMPALLLNNNCLGNVTSTGSFGLLTQTAAARINGRTLQNFSIYADIKQTSYAGASSQRVGFFYRELDTRNYYMVFQDEWDDTLYLRKRVGGVVTTIASLAVPTGGTWHRLRVDVNNDTHRVYYDGNLTLDATDSDINDAGSLGLWTYTGDLAAFPQYDNVSITTDTFLYLPANNSVLTSLPVALQWVDFTNTTNTYQISTDNQFINIVAQGTVATHTNNTYSSPNLSLSYGTDYYWRAKSLSGSYTPWWKFTTPSSAPAVAGYLNIVVMDERNLTYVSNYTATIYNTTYSFSNSTDNGVINFSSSEIASGQYLLTITPNSTYAARSILITSPTNVTAYVPSTGFTIDTISFYLLDYTSNFGYSDTVFTVYRNASTMYSSYFDADAKVAVNLIDGDSYFITVANGDNLYNWGNYVPAGSGSVQITITDIGVNRSALLPFTFNTSYNTNTINLAWVGNSGELTQLNYTILQGTSQTLVHQLITSVSSGESAYIVTNTSDVYYVYITALTSNGYMNSSFAIDYSHGIATGATGKAMNPSLAFKYGSYQLDASTKNQAAILILILLTGSFGALFAGIGAIISVMFAVLFAYWGWLTSYGASIGVLGGLLLYAIIYFMQDKGRKT